MIFRKISRIGKALPDVDRCSVHVDHEVDHKPVYLSYMAVIGEILMNAEAQEEGIGDNFDMLHVTPTANACLDLPSWTYGPRRSCHDQD